MMGSSDNRTSETKDHSPPAAPARAHYLDTIYIGRRCADGLWDVLCEDLTVLDNGCATRCRKHGRPIRSCPGLKRCGNHPRRWVSAPILFYALIYDALWSIQLAARFGARLSATMTKK